MKRRQNFILGNYLIQAHRRYKYLELLAYKKMPDCQYELVAQQEKIPLKNFDQNILDAFIAGVDPLLSFLTPKPQLNMVQFDGSGF